jgi:F-type H+-transporting ATPase subunit delta
MKAAEELDRVQAVASDLDSIGKLLKDSREFRLLVASPVVSKAKKTTVFRELFSSRIGKEVMSFLLLLIRKGREGELSEIVAQFHILLNERMGIVDVQVTSAVELTNEQQKFLNRQLEHYTKKKVRMSVGLDQTLKGGLLIQIGDKVLDATIRHQLEMLRGRFAGGVTH